MVWPLRKTFRSESKYLAACGSEVFAPALRLKTRGLQPPTEPAKWRKGLLVGANHIGDVLYRSSSLSQLSAGLPDCEWHFLAPPPANEVLRGNPAISKVHPFDLPSSPDSADFKALKQENYDVAICYDTGMYLRPLKLAVALGIPNRVGYVHKGFSAWVTHPVPIRYPQPFPAYFRDLVAGLVGKSSEASLCPRVFPTEQDDKLAAAFMSAMSLVPARPIIACFPATRQPGSEAVGAAICKILWELESRSPKIQTVILGSPSEMSTLERLKSQCGISAKIGAPPLPILPLVSFLKNCTAVLCADSGPRHLANAAGTKVFFIRNLASEARETGVYLESETDLAPQGLSHKSFDERVQTLGFFEPKLIADQIMRDVVR